MKLSNWLMFLTIASGIAAGIAFYLGAVAPGLLLASTTVFLSGAGLFATFDGK